VVVPAMAFYGGLGDLLATAAMDDWPAADWISIAYALSGWRPTLGTRATSQSRRRPTASSVHRAVRLVSPRPANSSTHETF
jgi:hypothetical protein